MNKFIIQNEIYSQKINNFHDLKIALSAWFEQQLKAIYGNKDNEQHMPGIRKNIIFARDEEKLREAITIYNNLFGCKIGFNKLEEEI